MIHLTFANWRPSNWRGATPMAKSQYPLIMNSSDDGEHWSEPVDVPCPTCKGGTFRTAGMGDIVPGDSRGLCVINKSLPLGYRLISPTWSGSQYSDDGGHSWGIHLQGAGENSITTWWNKSQGAFLMTSRAGKGTCRGATGRGADMCYRYSQDGLAWGPYESPTALWPMLTSSADSSAAIGIPGGMVFIHGGGVALPPPSVKSPPHQQTQTRTPLPPPPPPLGSESGSGGSGVTTFFSPDGQQWKLIKHVWPLYGGYSTVEALGTEQYVAPLCYDLSKTKYLLYLWHLMAVGHPCRLLSCMAPYVDGGCSWRWTGTGRYSRAAGCSASGRRSFFRLSMSQTSHTLALMLDSEACVYGRAD